MFKLPRSNKEGLGHEYLWQLKDSHPFHQCAVEHDRAYDKFEDDTRKLQNSDKAFRGCCLKIAKEKNSKWLEFQAHFFYYVVVVFRVLFR